jgi:tRNA (guanine37-N1)-methyltransferase
VRGLKVPEVLVSGDHGKVAEWREEQSKERTEERRPDLADKVKQKSRKQFRQL